MGRFRSNFWRRIRIRNQNQPIASGFWDIWGYVVEKWGLSLLLRLCTRRKKFFWFFLKFHHLALLFPFKMSYWIVTSDFFSQRYGHIKFWHLSEQPYEHSHWLSGAYHFAFENLSWKFVLAGFDVLWIRIYSQKIEISISRMADSKWRIEIHEIKRFRSLKTLTWGFRSCWLRKWGRKIDISISKIVDSMSRIEIDREHSIGIRNPAFSRWIFECKMICTKESMWMLIRLFG